MTCDTPILNNPVECPVPAVVLPYPNGFSVVLPTTPPAPTPMFERVMREFVLKGVNGASDQTIRGLFVYDLLTNSVTPVSVTYFNEATNAAYTGSPTLLEATSNNDIEAEQDSWCAGGINYTRFVEVRDGMPTPNIRWLNDLTNVISAVAPAGAMKGACVVAAPQTTVTGTGLPQIAGDALSASNPNFAGQQSSVSTNAISGNLISVTVSARNVQDGMASNDRVEVNMPDGTTVYMFDGETKSFNLTRGQEFTLRQEYTIKAYGMAYANIHGTFE